MSRSVWKPNEQKDYILKPFVRQICLHGEVSEKKKSIKFNPLEKSHQEKIVCQADSVLTSAFLVSHLFNHLVQPRTAHTDK